MRFARANASKSANASFALNRIINTVFILSTANAYKALLHHITLTTVHLCELEIRRILLTIVHYKMPMVAAYTMSCKI